MLQSKVLCISLTLSQDRTSILSNKEYILVATFDKLCIFLFNSHITVSTLFKQRFTECHLVIVELHQLRERL